MNPALLKAQPDGTHRLFLNLRRTPAISNDQLRVHLDARLKACLRRAYPTGGWFGDEPLAFDPEARLVKRLMAVYQRVTGSREPPGISGGGTYAKRLPRAIAFGMWFPDKPYPGHDVDEQASLVDLHKGTEVLLEVLADLALNPPLSEPFKP